MRYPLLNVALWYASGILAASLVSLPWLFLLAGTGALLLLAVTWARARRFLLYPLMLLTGWTNSSLHTAVLSPQDLRAILGAGPALATVRGVLRETPTLRVYERDAKPAWRTLARLQVTEVCLNQQDWQPAAGRTAVTSPGPLTNLFAGQTVEITGVIARPKTAEAEGLFDYRAYLAQQDIYYLLRAESETDWHIVASPPSRPLADRFRDWARQALARGLPVEDESLRLEWALTLGWKPALTEEVSEPFVRAATYHIFAVDGLRMAILFGIFFGLFRVLGVPRTISGLALVPLIWFYVALTGWPASAIRATVMLTVVIGSWVLRRPVNLINSLLAAALIILVWQPPQLFQAGFQLSFCVVLCLVLMLEPLFALVHRLTAPDPLLPPHLRRHWPPVVALPARYAGDVLLTSFAAWVGSIPLVAYYFHIVTPVSTPANLVAVPLCGLVLVSNLASLLLVGWFSSAAEVFNHAGWFVMECIRITSHWFAGWPKAYFYVPAPSLFTCVVYYGLLLAGVTGWLFRPAMRRGKFATVTLALVIWSWTCWRESSTTRLTVLPVGGGLAVFCDARGWSDDLLIDCGPTNAVQSLTKPFLRAQGVNRLAHLLLTHGDLHHVGGAEMLADLFPVKHVGASPVRFRSTAYRQTLEHFTQTPDLVQRLSRNERVGDWTILHPTPEDRFPQADDNALVLAASFDGTRVLLLSDLGRPGQAALLERTPDLRADIVVTGLPTASEAISDNFLDAIQPRVIIVGDSDFPVSERASARLCERLAQRSVPVIYTRSAGAVTLEFRGHEWEIRTMEGFRIRSRDAAQRTGAPLPPRDSSGRSGDSNQSSYGVTTTLAASPKPSN